MVPAELEKVYRNRRLPAKYDGIICTFDLDKTYLATEFETFSGLVKIPFEKAEEKRNIPGTASLVRELRRGVKKDQTPTPIYFISGSPRQLENVVREKLELDGVSFDGILFKDFGSALRKLQFKKLIDKIGYKLGALLYARSVFSAKANELLFGDDSEYDALIYAFYADIVAGNLEDFEILTILKKWDIAKDEFTFIAHALELLKKSAFKPRRDAVQQIFIHLETGRPPAELRGISERILPTKNYFQTAIILYHMEYITRAALFRIISDLIRHDKFAVAQFASSTEDLIGRSLIERKEARKLLKIVGKGNPLALPRRIIADLVGEFTRMTDSFSALPEAMKQPKRRAEDQGMGLVERYIRIQPKRNV